MENSRFVARLLLRITTVVERVYSFYWATTSGGLIWLTFRPMSGRLARRFSTGTLRSRESKLSSCEDIWFNAHKYVCCPLGTRNGAIMPKDRITSFSIAARSALLFSFTCLIISLLGSVVRSQQTPTTTTTTTAPAPVIQPVIQQPLPSGEVGNMLSLAVNGGIGVTYIYIIRIFLESNKQANADRRAEAESRDKMFRESLQDLTEKISTINEKQMDKIDDIERRRSEDLISANNQINTIFEKVSSHFTLAIDKISDSVNTIRGCVADPLKGWTGVSEGKKPDGG